MNENLFFTHIFRFYSKSLSFPFTELGLELQHIFRQMEINFQNELEEQLAAHALDIVNYFQGEDMSNLQGEFSRLFSYIEGNDPLVSILFTDYGDANRAQLLADKLYESTFDVSFDETPDSMINLLDYYSYLSETGEVATHLTIFREIVLPFSKQLASHGNVSFYKEVAKGLAELCDLFEEE